MIEAALWGLLGGSSLVIGAILAIVFSPGKRAIGLVMGFGAGVLVSAVAYELVEEAFHEAGKNRLVAAAFGVGALAFYLGDLWIDSRGGDGRKRSDGRQTEGSPRSIVLGTVLDGVPESAVIGISMIGGGAVSITMVAAVFMSNMPEALAATTGLAKGRTPTGRILRMWAGIALACAAAAAIGFTLLGGASATLTASVQAFAAGAILVMLADTMMPEAFEHGGRSVGLATVVGFAAAFALAQA
jgi:ZIP family zinc transporter